MKVLITGNDLSIEYPEFEEMIDKELKGIKDKIDVVVSPGFSSVDLMGEKWAALNGKVVEIRTLNFEAEIDIKSDFYLNEVNVGIFIFDNNSKELKSIKKIALIKAIALKLIPYLPETVKEKRTLDILSVILFYYGKISLDIVFSLFMKMELVYRKEEGSLLVYSGESKRKNVIKMISLLRKENIIKYNNKNFDYEFTSNKIPYDALKRIHELNAYKALKEAFATRKKPA